MLNFTLFTANVRGDKGNCIYPNRVEVTNREAFKTAMQYDHVCGTFRNDYRSNNNFLESNVLAMDCDNDHGDNPGSWVTPDDVARAFPEVAFYVNYSRNHMKIKGSKSARPRFHIYFPIPTMTSGAEYNELKKKIQAFFPYFDEGALGEARFFFGTESPMIDIYDGTRNVASFIFGTELVKKNEESCLDAFAAFDASTEEIVEGSRNTTMSRVAARIIKRIGNTKEAYSLFLLEAAKCNPPLGKRELKTIWNSAVKFGKKISQNPDYIPPEIYNSSCKLDPKDHSDVGQALMLASEYKQKLRYSTATEFIVYNGSFWEESAPLAQGLSQELTERQLEEAKSELSRLTDLMKKNGILSEIASLGQKKAIQRLNPEQQKCFEMFEKAREYEKYVTKRRDSKEIAATLVESIPTLNMKPEELDKDEFALNCPGGTWDLRKGLNSMRLHNAEDFITKECLCDPSEEGNDIWQEALNLFFNNDKDLIDYVQRIVGLASIGKVYVEALVIAYGGGRNGKSTFWNAISRVLGGYSGNISADMLTAGCRRNVKPELAEAKGKRLLIAAELEEGMRLNTSNVKQLCSTDKIYAEKKYKAPFSYIPTHTLVLYTNHLPKVGAMDQGTWRRLIIIPFKAKIEEKSDIKNYTDYLVENAGGAILSWILEGAKKVIEDKYKITPPEVVRNAIGNYKDDNDWLSNFIEAKCVVDEKAMDKSGEFYTAYRMYCLQNGEFARSTTEFYAALEDLEIIRKKRRDGNYVLGIRLKNEFEE